MNPEIRIRGRVLLGLWIAAVIAVSIQATLKHTNNFETFRWSWFDLASGRDPYGPSVHHQDFYKYSPAFAVLFAPFAILPFWAGVLAWNALNAGTLYWALGRVLGPRQAFAARVLVFMDTVGAMQNVQSNALVAGLMILACADVDEKRELRSAVSVGIGAAIKLFPVVAATYAIFRPYRIPRYAAMALLVAAALVALPLLVVGPSDLRALYHSWAALQQVDAHDRGYSIMNQMHLWLAWNGPNWPVQLAAVLVLLAPLVRISHWGIRRFRLLYLASLLMFCVLFNHKAESPSFIVAVAGVAIWWVVAARTPLTWATLAIVTVGTILSSSDAMPRAIQNGVFEPYRLKILPVLLVWVLTQRELWRHAVPAHHTPRTAPAT